MTGSPSPSLTVRRSPPVVPPQSSDRVLIVGEHNPHGDDPDMALYPSPDGCAGDRLRRVLGVTRERYLAFSRENLCLGTYCMADARDRAVKVRAGLAARFPSWLCLPVSTVLVVLCGTRVKEAFGLGGLHAWCHADDADVDVTWLALPHPSGRSRVWGAGMWRDGGSVQRTRNVLRLLAPRVPWGETPDEGPRGRRPRGRRPATDATSCQSSDAGAIDVSDDAGESAS